MMISGPVSPSEVSSYCRFAQFVANLGGSSHVVNLSFEGTWWW
jgi:hypothetical protein